MCESQGVCLGVCVMGCVWVCVRGCVWGCVWVCVCLELLCGFCLCKLCLALNNPMVSYNREHTHIQTHVYTNTHRLNPRLNRMCSPLTYAVYKAHTHPGMACGPGTADTQYHRAPARERAGREKRESRGWLSRTARMLESQLQSR